MPPSVRRAKIKKKIFKLSACIHIIAASPLKFMHADDNAGTHMLSELFIATLSFNASHLPGFLQILSALPCYHLSLYL